MAAGVRIVLAERKSYFNKFLVAVVAEVADETATEKTQKVLPRWAVGDERDGSVGQFHDQFIRVDVVSTEDSVPVADTLQDGQPCLFAILELQKKRKKKKKRKKRQDHLCAQRLREQKCLRDWREKELKTVTI